VVQPIRGAALAASMSLAEGLTLATVTDDQQVDKDWTAFLSKVTFLHILFYALIGLNPNPNHN